LVAITCPISPAGANDNDPGGCQRGCQRSGTYLLASSLPIDGETIPVHATTDVGGTAFVFDATITATVEG
jgi:hypothetical protein